MCKVYQGGTGPAVTFTVSILINNTGSPQNSTVTLQPNTCVELHSADTTQANSDRVTITEPPIQGFTTQVLVQPVTGPPIGPTTGNSATVFVHNDQGSVVEFINTAVATPPAEGRFIRLCRAHTAGLRTDRKDLAGVARR